MNTPYTTRSGVQIGRLYTPPMPLPDRDALRLQRALLGDSPAIDWDGISIVAGAAFAACAALALHLFS